MVERDDYMREGFDPASLKVAQLRGILVEHEIPFSSAARKPDLVDLFNQYVQPKTASMRKKNATIVASSSGIIDMRDRKTDGEDSSTASTPAKRKPGRPRKSEAATPSASASASAAPTPSRRKSNLSQQVKSEPEDEASPQQPAVVQEQPRKRGRPRKSVPAAVVPSEHSESEDKASPRRVSFVPESSESRKTGRLSRGGGGGKSDEDGTFSDSNPFQSGSEASPNLGPAAKAAASARRARRKTTDGSSLKPKSSVERMQSSTLQLEHSKSSALTGLRNFMDSTVASTTPPRLISRLTGRSPSTGSAADDEGDTAEMDTEADQDDHMSPSAFAKMRTVRRQKNRSPRDAHDRKGTGQGLAQRSLLAMFLFAALAWTMWYAKESRALGFCDTGSNTNAIMEDRRRVALAEAKASNETLDDFSLLPNRLQPSCTPCPSHAKCAYGQVRGCASEDWVLQPNLRSKIPLSSWFLPLSYTAPRCHPDTQKLVLASELSLAVSHMLADFKGEIVCGTQKSHATVRTLPKKISQENGNLTYAIAEEAVKRSMSATRDSKVDDEYFDQIWYMALYELTDPRSNVIRIPVSTSSSANASDESTFSTTYFLAAKQPALSIACRSRLALRGWVLRARLYLFLFLSALSAFFYLRWRLSSIRSENAKVALLVQSALDRIQEQEYLHGLDPVLYPDDFVPLSHLRDHILSEEHDPKSRNRLWKKVAKIVEENSNVRTRQAQRKGEWLRVWQWIGVDPYRPNVGGGYASGTGTPTRMFTTTDVGSDGSGIPVA